MCELPIEIWCVIADKLCANRDYCALMRASWLVYNALNTQKYAHKCRFAASIAEINSIIYTIYENPNRECWYCHNVNYSRNGKFIGVKKYGVVVRDLAKSTHTNTIINNITLSLYGPVFYGRRHVVEVLAPFTIDALVKCIEKGHLVDWRFTSN